MEQAKCWVVDTRQMRKDAVQALTNRGTLVKVAGITLILIAALPHETFAAGNEAVATMAGGTGLDVGANKIYRKLINVGKWVIIVKGGIDTIKSVAEGDTGAAKKNFLGYVITYAILWALPWALTEVEKIFSEMDT